MTTPSDDLKTFMCTSCDVLHEYQPDKYAQLKAMTRIPSLPHELQTHIASFCDMQSLAIFSRMSKEWNRRAIPLLWRNLDFSGLWDQNRNGFATTEFFELCGAMMENDPERFAKLAAHVRVLDVGSVQGVNISPDSWIDDTGDNKRTCVFDVIARFTNLESLCIHIKTWYNWGAQREESGEAIAQNLKSLRSLKIGGQFPPAVLDGFASLAQQYKDLALINLVYSPGQIDGPYSMTFVTEENCAKFTNLETLHLCKLADLDPRPALDDDDDDSEDDDDEENPFVSGMRWAFPRDDELIQLEEWVQVLKHTSKTLRSLKLENRYLCGYGWSDDDEAFIEPGKDHPSDYGAISIQNCQQALFPVLFDQEWPELTNLTLVGMGTSEAVEEAVAHLKGRVTVEQLPARYQIMNGEATPDDISTPYEFRFLDVGREEQPVEDEAEQSNRDRDAN